MNDNFRCGDHEALVTFLYDECDAAERDAIASHVAQCASCSDEIQSLRSARALLATWTPPDASLGFRITRADEDRSVRLPPDGGALEPGGLAPWKERRRGVPVDGAWWRRPLPAWAQAAAAVLIFAAGMTVAGARGTTGPRSTDTDTAAPAGLTAITSNASGEVPAVSREDLTKLEQRLRAIETARVQAVSSPAAGRAVDEAALLRRVEALIAASEDRQLEHVTAIAGALRNLDLQRRADLRQMEGLGRVVDTTRAELGRQNNALNYVVTSLTSGAVR
jgi:hypothetical protein